MSIYFSFRLLPRQRYKETRKRTECILVVKVESVGGGGGDDESKEMVGDSVLRFTSS